MPPKKIYMNGIESKAKKKIKLSEAAPDIDWEDFVLDVQKQEKAKLKERQKARKKEWKEGAAVRG